MTWLFSIVVVSFGASVLPIFSSELYLVTVLVAHPELDWWIAGPAAAIGQLLGKVVLYLAARGVLTLPRILRRPALPANRWGQWVHRFRHQCTHHPRRAAPVLAGSALIGLPPFALTVVVAGMTRLPLDILIPISVAGRVVRLCLLAALPHLIHTSWWW